MTVIQFIYSIIGTPLGYLLYVIYSFVCSNVGIAILLFTFIIKAAMIPIYISQQKNTAKSAVFMPKVKEIQEKYKNNPQRQQEELAKLQQQGYKPYSGCLSTILSFLILFGVIDVVYKPLTHILHVGGEDINAVVEESYNVNIASIFVEECAKTDAEIEKLDENARKKHDDIVRDAKKILVYYNENCLAEGEEPRDISAFEKLDTETVAMFKTTIKDVIFKEYTKINPDKNEPDYKNSQLPQTDLYRLTDEENAELGQLKTEEEKQAYRAEHSFSESVTSMFNTMQTHYGFYQGVKENDTPKINFNITGSMQRELYSLECFGTVSDKFTYRNAYSEAVIRPERKAEFEELYENLNFVGIPLGQVPSEHFGFPMILIPILSFLFALAQTFISSKLTAKNNPETAQAMGFMKIMLYIMPLISLWIAFTVPAGAGFYWTISSLFGIIQTVLLNVLYNPQKLRERAKAELDAKSKNVYTEAEKVVDEKTGETLSQKEINRRKLAEARKADALKYGEEYKEDDDD